MSKLAGSLDANAILRLLLNDIPAQAVAVAALVNKPQQRYAVTDWQWWKLSTHCAATTASAVPR